jgi:hypothetical protein
MTNKMQLYRIIYCSLTVLHVSSDIFAHHQEHLNCIYSVWYYSRMSWPAGQPLTTYVNNTRSCKYSWDAPDDGWKYRSKHVEQSRNNKLFYTVASCWSFSWTVVECTDYWCEMSDMQHRIIRTCNSSGSLTNWPWGFWRTATMISFNS